MNKSRLLKSKYSNIRAKLDIDPNNSNWYEVDVVNTHAISPNVTNSNITFGDLFSGAGGFSVGASMAGFTKLMSIEIDKDASNTIRLNFPNSKHYHLPIQDISNDMLSEFKGKIDVLFGGPPCQGFSVAGLRNPADPRNKLFKEYVRVAEYLQPKFIVLENVPGILTMEDGKVYKEILSKFSDIGYPEMSVRILEAAEYGVPQLRTRAIFIGNNIAVKNPYPKPIYNTNNYLSINSSIDDLKTLPRNGFPNHEWTVHSEKLTERISKILPGDSLYSTFKDAYKRQYINQPSMTVKENHGGCHVHYELNRVLSAREMARLQTFPDNFIFTGTFKRVYWQIGNAVPCLLAKYIALAINKQLSIQL